MSKQQGKKKRQKKEQDDMAGFIEEDQQYEGYEEEQQNQQGKEKNMKLTHFATTYKPEKTKIAQTDKGKLDAMFGQIGVEEPKKESKMEVQESSDEELEELNLLNKLKEKQNLNNKMQRELALLDQLDEDEMPKKAAPPKPQNFQPLRKNFQQLQQEEQKFQAAAKLEMPAVTISKVSDLPQEFNFYLLQVFPLDQKLFLFGILESGERLAIQIPEIRRDLYFILRGDSMSDSKQEIDRRLKMGGITSFDSSFEDLRYVFEVQGISRKNHNVYRVRYPFSTKCKDPPKPDWEGITYKYVLGTTYTPLQIFLVNNNICGPSWITIKREYLENAKNNEKSVWLGICPNLLEAEPVEVSKRNEEIPVPAMRVISFSLKFVKPSEISKKKIFKNVKDPKQNVIFIICMHYCKAYNIESKPKKLELSSSIYYLSSMEKQPEWKDVRKVPCVDEDTLLSHFMADINALDPDFLVCHDAANLLDALISRLERLKNNQVGKLGRLVKARQLPKSMHQRLGAAISGRLLVDTFVHSKDMMRLVDYSLANMVRVMTGQNEKNSNGPKGKQLQVCERDEMKKQIEQGNVNLLYQIALDESEWTFNLMNHLEIIQLTKQLTNICGNVWRRSLDNARAERNEFLIMHECKKQGLLIPDKFSKYQYQNDDEEEQQHQPTEVKKKKKYTGGLVLDPKKGLHSEYILLLDFNSLYPSIIRQYNVCFSKIDRPMTALAKYYKTGKKMEVQEEEEEKEVATLPKEDCVEAKWGFLPRLIDRIVRKRNEYKRKMKTAEGDKILVYDIIQKAYKLVSNSIYGCLGFSNSRFYAPHLAAFITSKGRDALLRAKDIVEKSGVDVIYGDTDSLMLKPMENADLSEVAKIQSLNEVAKKLKKEINKEYTKLEIDIDGIFKPLLLLMKKKYVAMKLKNFDEVLVKKVQPKFQMEYKGIDLVKRDGCQVSKRVSRQVLDILMKNKGTVEQAVAEIYRYIEEFQKWTVSIKPKEHYKQFLLAKTLNKLPTEYKHGSDRMPHVKVALDRINIGKEKPEALVNHAIYYLITEGPDDVHLAQKAFDDKRFLSSQQGANPLKIDMEYYKAYEILPPILRLFAQIKQISEDFFYDTLHIKQKHKTKLRNETRDDNRDPNQDQTEPMIITVKELSTNVNSTFPSFKCPMQNCHNSYPFVTDGIFPLACTNNQCQNSRQAPYLMLLFNQIQFYLHQRVEQFYKAQWKCLQCNKRWAMGRRCCGKNTIRMTSATTLHDTVYKLQRIVRNTQLYLKDSKEKKGKNYGLKAPDNLRRIEGLLNRLLSDSQFETLTADFMQKLVF